MANRVDPHVIPRNGRRVVGALCATVLCVSVAGACGDDGAILRVDPDRATTDAGIVDDDGSVTGGDPSTDDTAPPGAERSLDRDGYQAIRVDQFGYRPGDPKVAVIADPEAGFDAAVDVSVGATIEVRTADDEEVVLSGAPVAWADGEVHGQSGDRGWWFDFSAVTEPGEYVVVDAGSGARSDRFEIGDDVYDDVLDAALRMFWFNRANVEHPAELAGPWADDAAFVGDGQDTQARSVDTPSDPASARDLSGGWYDAGDPNKYVTFAMEPVHLLLAAYEAAPTVFDDDAGIPESGNGVPDVLDEVRWELDWLEKMQLDDGGVLTKVGVLDYTPFGTPSAVRASRYYEEVCSSSTIAAAGMFAHAARVWRDVPGLEADAERLADRAVAAWTWFRDNERRDDCDPGLVRSGDADLGLDDQARAEVVAAVHLLALTGDPAYDAVVRAGYTQTRPFVDDGFGSYGPEQADALLRYRDLPGADPATVDAINTRLLTLALTSPVHGFDAETALYRAALPDTGYHWGSNRVMANVGTANLLVDADGSRQRALAHLHWFHGVNPLAIVYLSNTGALGAEHSVQSLFHHWFGAGTEYDVERGSTIGVPPGFVVGGPNVDYSGSASPPAGQPPMKAYRDWGDPGEPVWEITEPAVYYQAAYVRLLAGVLGT